MVSSEYFTDRGQTVSINSVVGVTGCQLVQAIWTNCFFKWGLEQPVEDSSFQDGNQPYTCTMTKPFSAIGQIRDIQVYPVDYAGNVMLFHNRTDTGIHQVVHAPLSVIYTGMSSRWTFYQRETWGIDWRHMFGWDNADSAIISINDQSRSIMLDPKEYSVNKQITVSTDMHAGKHAAHDIFPDIAQGAGINNPPSSSDRVDPEHDPYNIIARARWYAHCMKAVPKKYLVRVPLKTGLNITVGQGCTLKLQPTRSKVSQSNRPLPEGSNLIHPHSGDYFITDLIHEIHNDLREVNGTTTFNCLKGGKCKI